MEVASKMKKTIDTQLTQDPNVFGEIIREFAFKDSYGCYSCFELLEEFNPVTGGIDAEGRLLMALGLHPLQEKEVANRETNRKYKNCVHHDFSSARERTCLYSNGDIHIGWYWDGDGTLAIIEGKKAAVNNDCKKSDRWEWVHC